MSDDTLIGKARERLAEATASVLDVEPRLGDGVRAWLGGLNEALGKGSSPGRVDQVGTVIHVADGVATIAGLPDARFNELLRFPGGVRGLAFNLDPESIGCVILGDDTSLSAGDPVRLTGQVAVVPVGEALLGRVVDALGRPLDGEGAVECEHVSPVERESAPILERAPVVRQLVTGTTAIDALIPIGRGQRELIVGDRATGKTSLAVDAMISQRDTDIICIYVAIGQKVSTVKRVTESLRKNGSLRRTIIVSADADDSPGLQYIAPYAATTMGEHFMEQGKDVLVVYDDLTRHARSYREVSLLLRRPPGREAYPGDIFFIHSRLLERATHLGEKAGGGSLTAIPIVETQAKNISAYIPTNLISITDGQIFLDPDLFYKGVKPAIHVGKSVSRVGGKTQLPAIRAAAKQLRLEYAQFAELEIFTRFGATVEKETQQKIDRGRRIRELLKQSRLDPFRAPDEVMLLLAVSRGFIDRVPVERVTAFVKALRGRTNPDVEAISARIESGAELTDDEWEALAKVVESVADDFALEKAVASEPVAPEPAERERDAEPPAA
ncbi:MAG: F0F1 ATP synthase subunit alpha [Planctomycetota bacterium]|jgi:F-type H+-transporting ATPase subunit alpha